MLRSGNPHRVLPILSQAIVKLFYLAVVHHEVVTSSTLRSSVVGKPPLEGAEAFLRNNVFTGRLTFVLRPLLARSDLLLSLLAGEPPPPPLPPPRSAVPPLNEAAGASDALNTVSTCA